VDRVDQPDLERLARGQARAEQHQLHRLAHADQPRQEERGALGAAEPGLEVGPLEPRPLRRDHQVAGHRDAEAAGGRRSVDGGQPRLGRAPDLGDRAVNVLEDLLEHGPVAAPGLGRPQVAEVVAGAALADVLEVGAAAEHAAVAAQDHGADLGVTRELQPGLAQVLGGGDVERVEALAAGDGEDADRAVSFDADVVHGGPPQQMRGNSSPSASPSRRRPSPVSSTT
jgi:hypothetical protein